MFGKRCKNQREKYHKVMNSRLKKYWRMERKGDPQIQIERSRIDESFSYAIDLSTKMKGEEDMKEKGEELWGIVGKLKYDFLGKEVDEMIRMSIFGRRDSGPSNLRTFLEYKLGKD